MARVCKLYEEDVVYGINEENLFDIGVVCHTPHPDYPGKREVDIEWYRRSPEKVAEEKVKLCDRFIKPGKVVRKIVKGTDTQLGYCRCTDVKADVLVLGTQKVIVGVDSKDLIPMKEFVSGVTVFQKDSWIGTVEDNKTELTLRCSDGSRCIVSESAAFSMDDVLDERMLKSYENYSFYPGQQLWGPTKCFDQAKWLNITKSMSDTIKCCEERVHVTVEDVKIKSVHIQWFCKVYISKESAQNLVVVPKYNVFGESLKSIKIMNILQASKIHIGDKSFLIMKENFEVISLDEWKNRMSSRLYESHNNSPFHKQTKSNKASIDAKDNCVDANANCNDVKNVCDDNCDDFEDIKDEESGKSSKTTSVTSHFAALSVDIGSSGHKQRKRYPTKLLKKKKSEHMMKETLLLKPGEKLITEVLITETKADVVWQDGTVEHNILSTCLYPAHQRHPIHEFFPGEYVVDRKETRPYGVVKQVDYTGRTALITWMRKYHAGGVPHPEVLSEEEVSVYDIECHPDFNYRPGTCVFRVVNSEDSNPASSAGQVVDVHSTGKVEVKWVSGETSLCYPQEVRKYDYDVLWADERFSYEKSIRGVESEKSVLGNEENKANFEMNEAFQKLRLCMFRSKIYAVANEASNSVLTSDIKENDTEKPPLPDTEEDVAEVNSVGTFSMLESVPDRHMYKLKNFQPTDPSAFLGIVRKEIAILRSSLPEGIVVKSFEDRIDLYSVLIKGPKGTPYEDGLFFFDFQFPADYPKSSPLCHYISYCSDKLNPYIYKDGYVSLSLLSKWVGEGTERWNPGTSTLLQVIVSIQGLILVADPFYNHKYYKTQKGTELGIENSRRYNEMVVSNLVPAMTKVLLNPPEIFKQEITEHFQTQASKLTQRLESWLEISETWNPEHPASPTSPSTSKELHNCDTSAQDVLLPEFALIPASKGFGLSLRKSLAEFKEVLSSLSIV